MMTIPRALGFIKAGPISSGPESGLVPASDYCLQEAAVGQAKRNEWRRSRPATWPTGPNNASIRALVGPSLLCCSTVGHDKLMKDYYGSCKAPQLAGFQEWPGSQYASRSATCGKGSSFGCVRVTSVTTALISDQSRLVGCGTP